MANRGPWLLGILVFLLLLPGVFWGLPSALTPQVDAPVPLGSLLFFADRRSTVNTIYPAFHQLLLLPFYGVAMTVYWILGGVGRISSAWPYGLRDVSAFFSVLIVITNLMSSLMAVLLLRCAIPLVEKHRPWIWFGVLSMAFNCVFAYYGRTGNLDMPYNFWLGVALVCLWRFLEKEHGSRRLLLAAGIAAALAIGSKDQAAGPVLGMGLAPLWLSRGSLRDKIREAGLFSLSLIGTYILVAILPHPSRWWQHVLFVTSPHAPTPIPPTLSGQLQILQHTLHRLSEVYTWPGLMLALAGAWSLYRREWRKFWLLTLPALTYYLLIIAKTRVAYPRFMLTFLPPLLVFTIYGAGVMGGWMSRWRWGRQTWTAVLVIFLCWRFVYGYLPVTYAQVADTRRQLAAELPTVVPPGSPLLITRMQGSNLPGAGVYENYRLMLLPGDVLIPPSRHAASILNTFDPDVVYILQGTGGTGLPWHKPVPSPPIAGDLVKSWKYPEWIREQLIVPAFYEFYLYRRTGPLPENYVAPPAELPDNPG